MGSAGNRRLASLAAGAADFIANYPEAAAWCARRVEQILSVEAGRQDELESEEREERRRAGRAY